MSNIPSLTAVQQQINDSLRVFFTEQIKRSKSIDPAYQHLWQEVADLGLSGGKRFRPYLTILAYHGFGGKITTKIMPLAMASELLHLALLVHDDIIDRDDLRYNQSNISGRYKEHYRLVAPELSSVNNQHYALSAAVLAGDMLLSSAYQLIASANLPTNNKEAVSEELAKAVFEVMAGELLDTEASFLSDHQDKQLKIIHHKTASYSCVLPVLAGAIAASAKATDLDELRETGTHLGIAYQLRDDYLGIFGDENKTGKPILSDLSEGKHTYLIRLARQKATLRQKKQLENLLNQSCATLKNLKQIRKIIEESGALTTYETKIKSEAKAAMKSLNSTNMQPEAKQAFIELIEKMLFRES